MKLSEKQIKAISDEYNEFVEQQYAGKSKKERQELGQFFTPPALTVKMLEKFNSLEGTILDPTCGAGGLLAAAVKAGANPANCYGIEIDPAIAQIAIDRLSKLGIPSSNIKIGDALEEKSYNFSNASAIEPSAIEPVEKISKTIVSTPKTESVKNLELENFRKEVKRKFDNLKTLKDKGFEPPLKWEWWIRIFDKIESDLKL